MISPQRWWVLLGVVVLLLSLGAYLSYLPLDSGDNYCGQVFVTRTTQGQFNGCDDRLCAQRLLVAGLVLAAGAAIVVLVRWHRAGLVRHNGR